MTQKVRTALVVDDSRLARMALTKLLQKREVEVDMVGTGGEALDYLSNTRPDVVFMDYMMPDMDGFEATRKIRGILGDEPVPVVMYTSQDSDEDREKARQLGIAGFLSKPSGEDSLDEILEVLAQRSDASTPHPPAAEAMQAAANHSDPAPVSQSAPEQASAASGASRQLSIPWEEIRHVARQAAEGLAGEHAERIARDRVEPLRREVAEAVEQSGETARRMAEQHARSAADSASREVAERIADRTARMIAQSVAEEVAARVAREVGPEAAKRIIEDVRGEVRSHVERSLKSDEFRHQVREVVNEDCVPELRKSLGEHAGGVARKAASEAAEKQVRERFDTYRSELAELIKEGVDRHTAQLVARLRRTNLIVGIAVVVGALLGAYSFFPPF